MMPLLMANLGEEYTIKQIGGREKDNDLSCLTILGSRM